MSNYLSQPIDYSPAPTDANFNLLSQIALMKQSKFDVNKDKIQQTLNSFGQLDVLRGIDKDYIAAKLTDLTKSLNDSQNKNLSQSNVVSNIDNSIMKAARDPFILSAMENTIKYKNFQAEVGKIKEKKPELYNDNNYAFALSDAGFQSYMDGKSDKIGTLQYTPYSDYNKKINDFVLDLEAKKKDQIIEVPDGRGGMTKTTTSGLSPLQVRNIAESMLDGGDRKQIEIDGWANAGSYDNPEILTKIQGYVNNNVKAYDTKIDSINKEIKDGGLSKKDLAAKQAELNTAATNKSTIQKNFEVLTKNPKAAATYLQQEKVFNGIVNRFSALYTESQQIVKDEIYWANKNYDLDLKKFDLDVAKFQYEQVKDSKKKTEEVDDLIVTNKSTTPDETIDSVEKEIDDKITTISTTLDNTLTQYKSALEAEASAGNKEAKTLLQTYAEKLKAKKENQSDTDIFRAVVTENGGTNNKLAIVGDRNYQHEINMLTDDLDLYVQGKTKAVAEATTSHIDNTVNSADGLKAFYDNPNTKMLWKGNQTGNTQVYSVKDILIANKIIDKNGNKIGDLKTRPELLKALEQSYWADSILSQYNESKQKTDYTSLKKLAGSFGEDSKKIMSGATEFGYNLKINPNTKTGQFLLKAQQAGLYDKFSLYDQSLSGDDATIGKFLNGDYRKTANYSNSLKSFRDKLPNQQVVGISPDSKALYGRITAIATSANENFKPVEGKAINITQDGDFINITQTTSLNSKGEIVNIPQISQITKADFQRNAPELASKLNFAGSSAIYTYDKLQGKPLLSPPVKYQTESTNDLYEWTSEILLKNQPQFRGYITNTDSKETLKQQNSVLIQQLPEAKEVINEAVDNSSDYGVQMEVSAKFGQPKLFIKLVDKNTKETIHSLKMEGVQDADNFKPILDSAPQVYYSMLIDDILKRQLYSKATGSDYPAYEKLKTSLSN